MVPFTVRLDRALEDHELIQDVMSLWPKKDKPKLLLRDFATKNVLWSDNPPVNGSSFVVVLLSCSRAQNSIDNLV